MPHQWQGDANELMVCTRKLYKTSIKNKRGDGRQYSDQQYLPASAGSGNARAERTLTNSSQRCYEHTSPRVSPRAPRDSRGRLVTSLPALEPLTGC